MGRIRIFLLGKFCFQCDQQAVAGLDGKKTQELLCFLLIFRHNPHTREKIANLLWEDKSDSQSKQYLRQTLWQIQSSLDGIWSADKSLITVESDWLQINGEANLWVDIVQLEQAFALAQGSQGHLLTPSKARKLMYAAGLYRGDLLETCYQDWCILERERFQNTYLAILDWLVDYCLACRDYAAGVDYGMQLLRCDIARERTHRKLMRLHYLNNNRTGALRQYQRCRQVLEQEFEVEPATRTVDLYNQIRDGRPLDPDKLPGKDSAEEMTTKGEHTHVLKRLNHITEAVQAAHKQIAKDVEAVRLAIADKR